MLADAIQGLRGTRRGIFSRSKTYNATLSGCALCPVVANLHPEGAGGRCPAPSLSDLI